MTALSILLSDIPGLADANLAPAATYALLSRNDVEVLVTADRQTGALQLEAELYDMEDVYEQDEDADAAPSFTPECRRVMKRLRHAQFCYAETGGFRLAVRPGTATVLLQATLPLADANSARVARTFEPFVQVAAFWKQALPKVAKGGTTGEFPAWDASAELSGAFGMRV